MLERKTKGSIVCPGCARLISANARECIHCGRKNPGLWGYGHLVQKYLGNGSMVPVVTMVCVFLYALSLLLDLSALFRLEGMFRLLSPDDQVLINLGMSGLYPLADGRWWTVVTAMYLHGSVIHILFNMLWLRQLGHVMEHLFGTSRTFLIFTIAGVTGFFMSYLMGFLVVKLLTNQIGSVQFFARIGLIVRYTIGASGAIFGLFGALVYYGRRRGGEFGKAVYIQFGKYALILFVLGLIFPGVDNLSHAGGFVGGFLAAQLLGYQELKVENQTHRLLALGVAVVTVVCFILALLKWIFG
ncbi:rhomboid family intramembrane serine protease [candidate division KSB1 bacterium]|nr:rhomboid family intramembrane serine protease [candidate division KSB1 bacterium]